MKNKINYASFDNIYCICEGGAERKVMELLLENDKLLFSKEKLWDNELVKINRRNAKKFEKEYLKGIKLDLEKAVVIRIIDNPKSEKFSLTNKKIKIIDVVTPPEIEIIYIKKLGYYEEFNKQNGLEAHKFLAKKLDLTTSTVKSKEFFDKQFDDVEELVEILKQVKRKEKYEKRYFVK